jgi:hypothetical protein
MILKRGTQSAACAVVVLAGVVATMVVAPPAFANTNNPGYVGYASVAHAEITTATAQVKIPSTITCPATGQVSLSIDISWIGFPDQVETINNAYVELTIALNCSEGTLHLSASGSESDDQGTAMKYLSVQAGDIVGAAMSYTHNTGAIRGTFTVRHNGSIVQTRAVIGEESASMSFSQANYTVANGATTPIPTLASPAGITFSDLTFNGAAAATNSDFSTAYNLVNGNNGHVLMVAKPLNGTGKGFVDAFKQTS